MENSILRWYNFNQFSITIEERFVMTEYTKIGISKQPFEYIIRTSMFTSILKSLQWKISSKFHSYLVWPVANVRIFGYFHQLFIFICTSTKQKKGRKKNSKNSRRYMVYPVDEDRIWIVVAICKTISSQVDDFLWQIYFLLPSADSVARYLVRIVCWITKTVITCRCHIDCVGISGLSFLNLSSYTE